MLAAAKMNILYKEDLPHPRKILILNDQSITIPNNFEIRNLSSSRTYHLRNYIYTSTRN